MHFLGRVQLRRRRRAKGQDLGRVPQRGVAAHVEHKRLQSLSSLLHKFQIESEKNVIISFLWQHWHDAAWVARCKGSMKPFEVFVSAPYNGESAGGGHGGNFVCYVMAEKVV